MNQEELNKLKALMAGGEIMALGAVSGMARFVKRIDEHPTKGPTAVLDNDNVLYLSGDHSSLEHFVMVMRIPS